MAKESVRMQAMKLEREIGRVAASWARAQGVSDSQRLQDLEAGAIYGAGQMFRKLVESGILKVEG